MSEIKYDPILNELREDDSDFQNAVLTNDLCLVFAEDLDLIKHNNEQ